MKSIISLFFVLFFAVSVAYSSGYNIGDKAADFKLKNIDGKFVSFSNYPDAKGFVLVFTCNGCPYAQAYQDRIVEIDKKYKSKGYPVIAINPNDPALAPADSFDKMVSVAKTEGFTFPYLIDEKQEVYKNYGATKTPHVYVLQKKGSDFVVQYIGAIDDSYQDATKVNSPFLASALDALVAGSLPETTTTKAIGCGIKDKSKK
ncbi:MAG TPA: thioredoxin family protein [Prolixibacteraceae bacterium]|nr:thioredoxin family protein [Prolixibacteraceae bacterium]